MGALRERFIDEMKLRGLSDNTVKTYVFYVHDLSNYCKMSPGRIDDEQVRAYLLHLIKDREVCASTANLAHSSIKFFYRNVLGRKQFVDRIAHTRQPRKLPLVLDRSEVQKIFDVTENVKHKAVLLTIYSAGLRVGEATSLKVSDIDSKRMQIFVLCAKGKKDRYAILSEKNLEYLRLYWKRYRPNDWLFYSAREKSIHYSIRSVEKIFERAVLRAGILKNVSVHALRHSFATHLLEQGTGMHHIQLLLGHQSPRTTAIYLHVQKKDLLNIKSPLDLIGERKGNPGEGAI